MIDLKKINGFPNHFWGWGGEDDAMLKRIKKHKLEIYKPIETSGYKVLEHTDTRLIPNAKNMTKWELTDYVSNKFNRLINSCCCAKASNFVSLLGQSILPTVAIQTARNSYFGFVCAHK